MRMHTPEDCIANAAALCALAERRPEYAPEYLLMAEMWLRVSEVVEHGELEKLSGLADAGEAFG
jgi:hypothetical protein